MYGEFECLFDSDRASWLPSFDDEELIQAEAPEQTFLNSLELIPREDLEWYRVNELVPRDEQPTKPTERAG